MARNSIQNANASLYMSLGSMSIASSASLAVIGDASNRNYTVGFWYKASPNLANNTNILTKGSFYSINFRNFTGTGEPRLSFGLYDGTANPRVTAVNATNDNTWKFIVGTRSNNTIKLYVNGVLVASQTNTTGDTSSASTVTSSSGLYNISRLFITLNTMTATEILNMYNSGRLDYTTVLNLPLSEGAATIAYDTSGNGNNGTITSPTWTRDAPSKTRKAVNGNLVYNGDFEIAPVVNVATTTSSRFIDGTSGGSTTNSLFGWYILLGGTSSVVFDSAVKYSGTYSLRLSTLATSSFALAFVPKQDGTAATYFNKVIPVQPNTAYTVTYRMKTNVVSGTSDGASVIVYPCLGDGTTAGGNTSGTQVSTTTDWTQYSISLTTGSTVRFLQINPRVHGHIGTGTLIMDAYFDSIELYPTTPTTRTATTGPYRKTVENLVTNGDFEYAPAFTAANNTNQTWIDGTTGTSLSPRTWGWCFKKDIPAASGQFDSTTSKTGEYSLKLSLLATGGGSRAEGFRSSSALSAEGYIPVLPSTSYTFSGWIKTNRTSGDGIGAFLRFNEFTGTSTTASVVNTSSFINTTQDWTQVTVTFTTAATTRFVAPLCAIAGTGSTADLLMDAYFDNIVLTKTTPDARTLA